MGGAQPLAVTMNDGVALGVEVDPTRIQRRLEMRLRRRVRRRPRRGALAARSRPRADGSALSIALVGNAAEVLPELRAPRRRSSTSSPTRPPPTTRSTATSRAELTLDEMPPTCARSDPDGLRRARHASRWPSTSRAMLGFQRRGRRWSSTTATTSAPRPGRRAAPTPSTIPGFVPAYIRPLFCEGKGPFRWAALSGDPADIAATDEAVLELFPDNDGAPPLDQDGAGAGAVPGPAGAHLLARLRRARPARPALQRAGRARARSRRRSSSAATTSTAGSVASPNRETEAMRDGSDAIADWPLLNALVNTAAGRDLGHRSTTAAASASATRIHAGMVVVADGTALAAAEARARPDHRPGHGRHPPRRRRLSGGGEGRRSKGAPVAHARG